MHTLHKKVSIMFLLDISFCLTNASFTKLK